MGRMGRISKENRGTTGKNVPAKKRKQNQWNQHGHYSWRNGERRRKRRSWNMPTQKRNMLQKEIDNKERDLKKQQRRRNQREFLTAWRDAVNYLREHKQDIKYSNKPIIELGKQIRTYRASSGEKQVKITIKEYTDSNYG